MESVFIYWDNSNIFHEAQRLAEERNGTPGARHLVRINFDAIMQLAHAGREVGNAVAAGSVPPEMRQLWNRLETAGVRVREPLIYQGLPWHRDGAAIFAGGKSLKM